MSTDNAFTPDELEQLTNIQPGPQRTALRFLGLVILRAGQNIERAIAAQHTDTTSTDSQRAAQ